MQINTQTMLASQTAITPKRPQDAAADFAPLAFKKTAAPALAAEPQRKAPEAATAAVAPDLSGLSGVTTTSAGKTYVRPGSQIDIKV